MASMAGAVAKERSVRPAMEDVRPRGEGRDDTALVKRTRSVVLLIGVVAELYSRHARKYSRVKLAMSS
jgi:hypothetical protein